MDIQSTLSAIHSVAVRSLLPRELTFFSALIVLVISLALIFAGRQVIKVLAFIVVGLAVGAVGILLGNLALSGLGAFLGFVLGFIVGGLLGLLLLRVGVGIALGLFSLYAIATLLSLPRFSIVPIIVGLVFFVVGVLLSNRILAVVTAAVGGLLFFDVTTGFLGVPLLIAGLVAILLAVIGAWVQWPRGHKIMSPAAVSSGVSSSSPPPPPKSNPSAFCPNCGSPTSAGAAFCPNCGRKLKAS